MLSPSVAASASGLAFVSLHLDGGKVTEYEGLNTVEELIAQGNPYITFSGAGSAG